MRVLILLFLLLSNSQTIVALEHSVTDRHGIEISIDINQAMGDMVMIWLLDHDEPRPLFDSLLQQLTDSGIEIWRVDLLDSYYLPRSSENVRTLDGEGVAAVIQAAHSKTTKKILLASYDRMPLPLLRGVNRWQTARKTSRLLGAILFYPNLFGAAPMAGEIPELDPILHVTNLPLVIYQPELGSQRWRLEQMVTALWQAGSPTYVYLVPKARDWFIMGEGEPDEQEAKMVARIPGQLPSLTRLLDSHPKPAAQTPQQPTQIPTGNLYTLTAVDQHKPAPPLRLADSHDIYLDIEGLDNRVILVNFWATWCPPCVEEIPSLNRLQAHYKNRDVSIVSVDFRESTEEIEAFLEERPVDFPVLMDRDGLTSLAWRVFSFPSSFIIDRQGRVRYTANRALNWDSDEVIEVIDGLLAEP
ncbi:MAG: TlpA family protein disulfide reductase [Candidatus Thiodiazotropha sp. (ex Clathrolucina costata)]|nr:TlpA family protein disulfide reductase [Candidatus Thiodiazotropha taylori]MCG7863047.1 TlpA family protein disulfide reductase [Candidatus Thiodiazotropha endolucinida]